MDSAQIQTLGPVQGEVQEVPFLPGKWVPLVWGPSLS